MLYSDNVKTLKIFLNNPNDSVTDLKIGIQWGITISTRGIETLQTNLKKPVTVEVRRKDHNNQDSIYLAQQTGTRPLDKKRQ